MCRRFFAIYVEECLYVHEKIGNQKNSGSKEEKGGVPA